MNFRISDLFTDDNEYKKFINDIIDEHAKTPVLTLYKIPSTNIVERFFDNVEQDDTLPEGYYCAASFNILYDSDWKERNDSTIDYLINLYKREIEKMISSPFDMIQGYNRMIDPRVHMEFIIMHECRHLQQASYILNKIHGNIDAYNDLMDTNDLLFLQGHCKSYNQTPLERDANLYAMKHSLCKRYHNVKDSILDTNSLDIIVNQLIFQLNGMYTKEGKLDKVINLEEL